MRTGKQLIGVKVESFDEDGIRLTDGRVIGLGYLQSAVLDQRDRQPELDRLIQGTGDRLFRIRIRLRNKDYENLQPILGQLQPAYESRSSHSAALVELARLFDSRLTGHWEQAIRSHFRLHAMAASDQEIPPLLESLGYELDTQTGLTGLIVPFGIPRERVVKNWESIQLAYKSLPREHPSGLDFYFFQLAKIANQEVAPELSANRIKLSSLENMLLGTLWVAMESTDTAEFEMARVNFQQYEFKPSDTAAHRALYYLAKGALEARREAGNRNQGLLDLLRVHAELGKSTESLSAAGLMKAVEILKTTGATADATKIGSELFSRYPSSIFANRLKLEITN